MEKVRKVKLQEIPASQSDLRGRRIGEWVILSASRKQPGFWKCRHECGREKLLAQDRLLQNKQEPPWCYCQPENRKGWHIAGRRFGNWVALQRDPEVPRLWQCRCDCGVIKKFRKYDLITLPLPFCKCLTYGRIPDLTGQRFGRLVAMKLADKNEFGANKWKCRCDCGKTYVVSGSVLRRGTCKSCGCIGRLGKWALERRREKKNQIDLTPWLTTFRKLINHHRATTQTTRSRSSPRTRHMDK